MNETNLHYDLIVIGGGPAGMAAAATAGQCGVSKVLLLERREYLGGILPQCIHDGFGLFLYQRSLTGPEYAYKWISLLEEQGVTTKTTAAALQIEPDSNKGWLLTWLSGKSGLCKTHTSAIIIACGCREKTRAGLQIPGSRPAGIYTAGCAQYMMNMKNYLPGKSAVILGFGDIGLIMARRMTLEGIKVKLILGKEITGLTRNMVQCVEDFNIPFRRGYTVLSTHGRKRLRGVTIAPLDEKDRPVLTKKEYVPCDTLLLAGGLIPELEILRDSKLISDDDDSLRLDENLSIGQRGIFACGNVTKVHDLADSVTCEGQQAGISAAQWILPHVRIPSPLEQQLSIEIREPKGFTPIQTLEHAVETMENNHGASQSAQEASGVYRKITCILCPSGCQMFVSKLTDIPSDSQDFENFKVEGFACLRGRDYAFEELLDPKRIITTCVKLKGALRPLLSVRTEHLAPKPFTAAILKAAREIDVQAPVSIGQILIENVAGSGTNLISTDEART